MFNIATMTEVHVASVTNRTEVHGEERVPAVSIGLELEAANTLLDIIDPKIREALYKAADDQEDLPGVEKSTPVLRCNSFERHTLPTSCEGWTLQVDDGIDDTVPMTFGGVKVDKFSVEAKQGGTIVLRFRAGTSDVDADKLGKLAMHNGQSIWITLTAPKPGEEPRKSAPVDEGEPDATDLFTGDSGDGPDETDGEGSETDADASRPQPDGSWPFPNRENNSLEAPPQSATTEVVQGRGSRTARGRAATKAALEAGTH